METLTANWPFIATIIGALILLIGTLSALFLRRVVPTNTVHIVQTGKSTTSYGRGRPAGNVYYEWPSWFPIIGVIKTEMPESVFQVMLKDYEAYDTNRLPFEVDVTAFFRIKDSDTAAQRVASFPELHTQLVSILQGCVRRVMATNALEETMHQRSTLGEQFTQEVSASVAEWGVTTVKMIEFMDIRDSKQQQSKVIHNIMAKDQARIDKESRVAVAEHARVAQLAEIEAVREVDIQKQQAQQAVGIREAQKEQEVGIAKEQSQQSVQEQSKATMVKKMAVLEVETTRKAEIAKGAAVIKANQDKEVAVVTAQQAKEVATVTAEGEKTATQTRAEGNLFASLKDAAGIEAKGKADGAAEQAKLMAPVEAQIKLAKEIAGSKEYQKYLIDNRQVEANETIGVAMARSMEKADIKIVGGNGTNVPSTAKGIMDIFTAQGGVDLGGMLTGFAATEEGQALLSKLTGKKADEAKA